jgi:hypothetical protein
MTREASAAPGKAASADLGHAGGSNGVDRLLARLISWTREVPRHPIAWRWIPLVVLGALAHWYWIHPPAPWGLWSGDAHEYAVLARRIAGGEGFTTGVILPAELSFGSGADHPSVLRAPLWPLVLAGFFSVLGPEAWVIHLAVLLFHLGTVALATVLAMSLAGTVPGLIAGVAVAASTPLVLFTIDGISESLFGFLTTLTFLLCARGGGAAWIGVVCGLAYLTRYNGFVLLAPACLVLAGRPRPLRGLLVCSAGVLAVCAPWWIRNFLVAGSPLYTLYNLSMYFRPEMRALNSSLWYALDPSPDHPAAMHPLEKFWILLPQVLARFSLASANLVALAGTFLACIQRDRLGLGFVAIVLASTIVLAMGLPNGRYLIPFVPAMLAIGAAAWWRTLPVVRIPALAAMLVLPLLPAYPPETQDLELYRRVVRFGQALGGEIPPEFFVGKARPETLARCLADRPVVLAQDAPQLVWRTDAIAIHLPSSRTDFWRIVEEHPVRFAQIRRYPRISKEEFDRHFELRPECAPDLYEFRGRREGAGSTRPAGATRP